MRLYRKGHTPPHAVWIDEVHQFVVGDDPVGAGDSEWFAQRGRFLSAIASTNVGSTWNAARRRFVAAREGMASTKD